MHQFQTATANKALKGFVKHIRTLSDQRSNDGKTRNIFSSKKLHYSILTSIGNKEILRFLRNFILDTTLVSCQAPNFAQMQGNTISKVTESFYHPNI